MSRSNIKNNFINRDYFRKPYLVDSYKDMVKKTPLASTNDYKTKPHSEFEKPYRDITYGQMQNIHPDEYRRANFNLNLDFDIIGEESEHKKCNSHLSIGPFDPVVQCNSVQIFQPSGKPPFEFFIIQGPGEMSGNIWVGPGCPYKTSGSITGDLVIVGVIDDCSGGPAVTKGNVTYPRHTSEAHFRIDEEEARARFAAWASQINVETDLFENKAVTIRTNTGFPITITRDNTDFTTTIKTTNVNDIGYIHFISIYIDSMLRLITNKTSTNVAATTITSLCKGNCDQLTNIPS